MTGATNAETKRQGWVRRHPFLSILAVLVALLAGLLVVQQVRVRLDLRRMSDLGRSVERAVQPGMTSEEARLAAGAVGVDLAGPFDNTYDGSEWDSEFVMLSIIRHRVARFPVYSERQIVVELDADQRVIAVRSRWMHTGP